MLKITNKNELDKIPFLDLKAYISAKIQNWTDEYQIADFNEIGCFVILDINEKELFDESEMEFTETLNLKNETYLHGVKILGDCYGEDIYLSLKGENNDV